MLGINVIHGNASVSEDDKERAAMAAGTVLFVKGFMPSDAYAAFVAEWAYLETDEALAAGRCQDYADMRDEKSLAWIAAEQAANQALTKGWARPEGASCSIFC